MIRLPDGVTRAMGRVILQTKKNSPHILFAGGVVGVVGGAVLACKATLSLEKTLDDIHASIEKVKVAEGITEQERNRLLALKYVRGVGKVSKLYLPATIAGGIGVACLTGAHVVLTKRNTALSGALVSLNQALNRYRDRVRGDVGEERERELFQGAEVTKTVGKYKGKVKELPKDDPHPYTRLFAEGNPSWEPNAELNWMLIRATQKIMNDNLRMRGHVFLNDVFDALNFERTSIGAQVGWIRDKNFCAADPEARIDFGLGDPANERFINGQEYNVWLHFNVDGPIFELI